MWPARTVAGSGQLSAAAAEGGSVEADHGLKLRIKMDLSFEQFQMILIYIFSVTFLPVAKLNGYICENRNFSIKVYSRFFGLVWVEALCHSQQFFSHVGTEPPLPGYYQYFLGGKCILLKDTTRRPE